MIGPEDLRWSQLWRAAYNQAGTVRSLQVHIINTVPTMTAISQRPTEKVLYRQPRRDASLRVTKHHEVCRRLAGEESPRNGRERKLGVRVHGVADLDRATLCRGRYVDVVQSRPRCFGLSEHGFVEGDRVAEGGVLAAISSSRGQQAASLVLSVIGMCMVLRLPQTGIVLQNVVAAKVR